MSNANRLRELAKKCEDLATVAPSEEARKRQIALAARYRRAADREGGWISNRRQSGRKTTRERSDQHQPPDIVGDGSQRTWWFSN